MSTYIIGSGPLFMQFSSVVVNMSRCRDNSIHGSLVVIERSNYKKMICREMKANVLQVKEPQDIKW